MALSDDIKRLVRREQDIQGVIGVLDTYLTDRQKRRDNYKPIKADKPKVVKITEIDEETGDEITRFVPESEAVSRKGGYVTKKAEVEDAGDWYKYDLDGEVGHIREADIEDFLKANPNANIGKLSTYKPPSTDKQKSQVWKNKLTRSIEGMKENIIAGFGEETYNSYLKLIDDASIVDNQLHDDIMKEINLGVDRKVNVYNTETEQFEIVTQKEVNDDKMGIYVQNKVGENKRIFMNKQDKDKANRYRSALAISKKNHNTLLKRHGGIDSFLSFSLSGKVSKTNYPDEFEKDMNELYKLQEEMYIAEFLQRNPGLSNESFEIFSGENALEELTLESYIDAKVSRGATKQNAMDSWNKLDNNKKDKFKNDIKNKLPEMKKLFLEDAKGYLEQYGTLPILNDKILGEVDFMSQILGGTGAPE